MKKTGENRILNIEMENDKSKFKKEKHLPQRKKGIATDEHR
jgi:hypothetical protein